MDVDVTGIFVIGSMCLCAVLIVASCLYYYYRKEQLKTKERLTAIEKGIAPKEIFETHDENGKNLKGYSSRKEAETYGGIKVLIIGLFLALALYYTAGGIEAAVWGLFVAGIGLAKIIVGMLLKTKEPST